MIISISGIRKRKSVVAGDIARLLMEGIEHASYFDVFFFKVIH